MTSPRRRPLFLPKCHSDHDKTGILLLHRPNGNLWAPTTSPAMKRLPGLFFAKIYQVWNETCTLIDVWYGVIFRGSMQKAINDKRLFFIRIVQTKNHYIWCKLGNRNQWGFFWVLKLHIFLHIFLHIAKPSLVHKMYLLTGAGYKSEGDIKFCSVSERINRKYRCLGVRILQNGNGRETGLQSLRFWEKVFSWIKFFFPLKLRISQTIFSYFTVSKNYGSMKITTSLFLEKIKSKLSSFKRVSPFFILIMVTKKREDK